MTVANDNAERIQLDPSQSAGVDLLTQRGPGIVVMTGPPGSGKTTVVRNALDIWQSRGLVVSAGAPTGKAAKRLAESIKQLATTLHRMLGLAPGGESAALSAPPDACLMIDADVVVVDEASMIDIMLMAVLVSRLRPTARLVLVGDVDQLPPVGADAPFASFIASDRFPVARLTTVHRSAAESWVGRNAAQRINLGKMPDLSDCNDFKFLEVEDAADVPDAAIRALLAWEGERPPLLSPQRQGYAGVDNLCRVLQEALNPNGASYSRKGRGGMYLLRVGDPVINTVNDYGRHRMNGETGKVVEADAKGVVIDYGDSDEDGGRKERYKADTSAFLQLAYALTIHKSQGSEFPAVGVVAHSTHYKMLSRRLLYTAVTRAKQRGVILIGDEKGVHRAVTNGEDAERNSALAEKLMQRIVA